MITLDIDDCIDIDKRIDNIKKFFAHIPSVRIFYRRSSHAGHYHIKIYGVRNNYETRRILGDDEKRVIIDMQREQEGLPINILFNMKRYPDGEIKFAGQWNEVF